MPDALLPPQPNPDPSDPAAALLADLHQLSAYLHARGDHTYTMAQRFAENARAHPESRAYDERQATMLEYQHYIWKEIAGLVDRLSQTHSNALERSAGEDHTSSEHELA